MTQTTNNHDENSYSWARRPGEDSSGTNPAAGAQTSAPAGPTSNNNAGYPYGAQGQPAAPYGQQPAQYGQPQYGQQPVSGAFGGAFNSNSAASGGTQTLPAYPATDQNQTGPLPQSGFGAGGQPPQPPKQRRGLGQPGWRGTIATGLGAALIASLLTAGVVIATQDDSPATGALSSTSQSDEPAAEAPVTSSNSQNPDWKAVASAVEPSVVSVQMTSGQSGGEGSGVILDADGRIVTNNHVVSGAQEIMVVLNDGRKYSAKIVGTDAATDLAVIQLENPPSDLKPASLGTTASVGVGDSVMAVGNPLGLAGTVTTGIVSALDRPVTTSASESQSSAGDSGTPVVTNAIQTDAAVNPGNSGGALVNAQGQLIGINSSIATLSQSSGFGQQSSSQSGSIGLGFAIPVDQVKDITNQLIENGSAQHPWLGITLGDTTVAVDNAQRDGSSVESVVADSPAAEAGLKQGDTVIAIDGEYVNGAESLMAQVRERSAGTEVTLAIVRDGKSQDVKVTLGTRPDSAN
ncbi:S1C family serine protease [Kineosporia babensis]|uniref:Trypsin-like peptidase domain-containing protein n=1 Tax=Kineosporia babensis TaxID=499548 RepID=A0A9X1NEX4_9ACTN|nr:trypsin-like peptidase domain-containing protein [Kineosporia babensis]MCD5312599.1 trypsin-like peptidase domain-containing protein [Kineosporia babensis]